MQGRKHAPVGAVRRGLGATPLGGKHPGAHLALRLELDRKTDAAQRLFAENSKLRAELAAADQAKGLLSASQKEQADLRRQLELEVALGRGLHRQLREQAPQLAQLSELTKRCQRLQATQAQLQKELTASQEKAGQENRRYLAVSKEVKQLTADHQSLTSICQNQEQRLLAQSSQANSIPEYVVIELNQLRYDTVNATNENTHLRLERDRLKERNTQLESDNRKLTLRDFDHLERISVLKERVDIQKQELRGTRDPKMLPAASNQKKGRSGLVSTVAAVIVAGVTGVVLGSSSEKMSLSAGSQGSEKCLEGGGARRKSLPP